MLVFDSRQTVTTDHWNFFVPTGSEILLTLKILVVTMTVLFAASVAAIVNRRRRLHGRINTLFTILTLATVFGFELLLRLGLDTRETFTPENHAALKVHLGFSIPATIVLPIMLWSGLTHRRRVHLLLAVVFTILWSGTFITGVFFL